MRGLGTFLSEESVALGFSGTRVGDMHMEELADALWSYALCRENPLRNSHSLLLRPFGRIWKSFFLLFPCLTPCQLACTAPLTMIQFKLVVGEDKGHLGEDQGSRLVSLCSSIGAISGVSACRSLCS